MLPSSSCAISSHQAPCVVHRNSPSHAPSTCTGSPNPNGVRETLGQRTAMGHETTLGTLQRRKRCGPPDPRLRPPPWGPKGLRPQPLLAPSTETLSGDSPWLKTAALPKPTPLFWAADIRGRQSPPDSQPRAPLRFKAGGPGLCWSSWRVALAAATVLHRRATAPSANRCRPRARPLIFRLPRPRLRTGSGGQNLPQGLRDGSSTRTCLTVGPGLHVFPSKTE